MFSKMFLVVLLLVFASALPVIAQEEVVSLRPVFEPGQSARYEQWASERRVTTVSAQGETQDITTDIETTAEQTWTVERIEADGSAVCKLETHFIEVTLTMEGESVTISTKNPTGDIPPFDDLVKAIVDHPLTLQVAADGSITSVEGGQAIRDALGELAELASEDSELIQQSEGTAALVGVPAALLPGAGWTDEDGSNIEVPVIPQLLAVPATMSETVSYTLEGVGEIEGLPIATVSYSSQASLEPDLSELPEELPPIDVRLLDSSSVGEILIDMSRHEIVATNGQGSYTVVASLTGPDGQTLTSQTTVTSQSQSLRIAEDE